MLIKPAEDPTEAIITTPSLPVRLAAGERSVPGTTVVVSPVGDAVVSAPSEDVQDRDDAGLIGLRELFELAAVRDEKRERARATRTPSNPDVINNLGLTLLLRGDVDGAEQHFLRALELKPNAQTRLNLVKCTMERGNLQSALNEARTILVEFPTNEAACRTVADLESRLGKHESSIAVLSQFVELRLRPSHAVYYDRGVQNLLSGRVGPAISDFRHALRLNERFVPALNALGVAQLRCGAIRKATQALRAAAALDKSPQTRHNLAKALVAGGNYEEAIALLTPLVQATLASDSIEAENLLAQAHWQRGEYSMSLRRWRHLARVHGAVMMPEQLALVRNNAGAAALRMNRASEAETEFLGSLSLSPTVEPYRNLLRHYLHGGARRPARELIERYGERFADDVESVALEARLYTLEGAETLAIELYEKALSLDETSIDAYAGLSCLLVDRRFSYGDAIKVCTRGLQFRPKNPVLLNNLAYCLLMVDEPETARRVLFDIRGETRNPYVIATRGLLAIKEGDLRLGEQLYKRAAKLGDRPTKLLAQQKRCLEVARYYWQRGEIEDANRWIGRALQISPPDDMYTKQARTFLAQMQKELPGISSEVD